MIQSENISKEHYINSIAPNYLVKLPFKKGETLNDSNVTCFFIILSEPGKLKCVGIEYFEYIDNFKIENQCGKYKPYYVYIFKGKPFDIEKERIRLLK